MVRFRLMHMLGMLAIWSILFADLAFGSAHDDQDKFVYQLEPITVTAEKREEDLQKVPLSVTAITSQQIDDAGVATVEKAMSYVPNVAFIDFGAAFEQKIFMRGIGSTHNAPSVNFNIDGITQFRSESLDRTLHDIESIEILRGPQGTLYGRNSMAGVVNIRTRKPDNELRAKLSTDIGNDAYQRYMGSASGPILEDKLFVGVAGSYTSRDGFTENTYKGSDVDWVESKDGRINLRWAPDDFFEANLTMFAEKDTHGSTALQLLQQIKDNPHKTAFDHTGYSSREVAGGALNMEWFFDKGTLTSVSSVQNLLLNSDSDYDYTVYDMNTFHHRSESWQYSQELRYSYGKDHDPLKWTTGVYGWSSTEDDSSVTKTGKDMPAGWGNAGDKNYCLAEMDAYGFAAFGQTTVTVFDRLDLTAGIRWEWERNEGDFDDYDDLIVSGARVQNIDSSASQTNNEWLPKFSAAYRFTDDVMGYGTVAWGYRSGGFNFMYDPTRPGSVRFDPETSLNYEAGIKTRWLDNRLFVNLAAYYIEIDDMQVSVGIPGKMTMMVENAGKATSRGVELEFGARPFSGFDLSASFGLVDIEYDQYNDKANGVDYAGKTPPYVPRYTYSLSAQYRRPITEQYAFFIRGELQGFGQQYWDNGNDVSEAAYDIVNARIGVESAHFDVYLWANNLFDKDYRKIGYHTKMGTYAQTGDPFTVGVNAVFKF